MRLLLCLAQRAGEVVSIEDLLNEVWSGVIVTPDSVYQAVASLRRVLGDDPKRPTYIANVPRLGYRMVASVGLWVDEPGAPLDSLVRNGTRAPSTARAEDLAPAASASPAATSQLAASSAAALPTAASYPAVSPSVSAPTPASALAGHSAHPNSAAIHDRATPVSPAAHTRRAI